MARIAFSFSNSMGSVPSGSDPEIPEKHRVLGSLHDGQNLFLKEEEFLGNTWRTDEVLGVLDRMERDRGGDRCRNLS